MPYGNDCKFVMNDNIPPCEESHSGKHYWIKYGGSLMCDECGLTVNASWNEERQCREWAYSGLTLQKESEGS